jgi:hypothetical protein
MRYEAPGMSDGSRAPWRTAWTMISESVGS